VLGVNAGIFLAIFARKLVMNRSVCMKSIGVHSIGVLLLGIVELLGTQ